MPVAYNRLYISCNYLRFSGDFRDGGVRVHRSGRAEISNRQRPRHFRKTRELQEGRRNRVHQVQGKPTNKLEREWNPNLKHDNRIKI